MNNWSFLIKCQKMCQMSFAWVKATLRGSASWKKKNNFVWDPHVLYGKTVFSLGTLWVFQEAEHPPYYQLPLVTSSNIVFTASEKTWKIFQSEGESLASSNAPISPNFTSTREVCKVWRINHLGWHFWNLFKKATKVCQNSSTTQ